MRVEQGDAAASAARAGSRPAFAGHLSAAAAGVAGTDPAAGARALGGRFAGGHGQAPNIEVRDPARPGRKIAGRALAAALSRAFAPTRLVPGA